MNYLRSQSLSVTELELELESFYTESRAGPRRAYMQVGEYSTLGKRKTRRQGVTIHVTGAGSLRSNARLGFPSTPSPRQRSSKNIRGPKSNWLRVGEKLSALGKIMCCYHWSFFIFPEVRIHIKEEENKRHHEPMPSSNFPPLSNQAPSGLPSTYAHGNTRLFLAALTTEVTLPGVLGLHD